jgi:acyl carrier protein
MGLAARLGAAEQARLGRLGMKALSPAQGLDALGEALRGGAAHLAVLSLDPRALRRGEAPPLLQGLAAPAPAQGGQRSERLLAKLKEAPPARRAELLLEELRAEAGRIFGLPPREVLLDKPLQELGLDSLMAVELRNALSSLSGEAISPTLAFDYPTLRALGQYLLERLKLAEPADAPPSRPGEAPQTNLESLSQEETLEELQRELKELGELL